MKSKREKPKKDALTVSQPFAGKIVKSKIDGRNKLQIAAPAYYAHQLNKFRDGEAVTLYISSRKPKRTLEQNAYYWGVYLPLISKETGEPDLDRLHELFKGKFMTTGIVEVLGQKVRMKKSTTELGVFEFCDYIMKIQAETGIEAPPTENYRLIKLEEGLKLKE